MVLRSRKQQEDGDKYIIRNSVICRPTLSQILPITVIKTGSTKMVQHVAVMRQTLNACNILVAKPEGQITWET